LITGWQDLEGFVTGGVLPATVYRGRRPMLRRPAHRRPRAARARSGPIWRTAFETARTPALPQDGSLHMTDLMEPPVEARAVTHRARRISIVWVIPLVAIAIGVWLGWQTLSKEGPTITVTFNTAEGLQPGQSQLKFKDIVFGTVKHIDLTPDHSRVVVTIATTREAEPLLTSKTKFWVVKPRLFAGSISGLETLLSGSYIGMLPGVKPGAPQREFTGQEDPPILDEHVPGRVFLLKAKRLGSISLGSPIFYRDLSVGEVLGWDIADMARYVTIHAFVRAPYDSYVHDDTRFWNASGLSIKLAGSGIKVQVESLKALILGGIAFETPQQESSPQSASLDNHVFPLFADHDTAASASYTRKLPLVSYFPGSVSGLAEGSEVTMHGLVVGYVTDVRLVYDRQKDTVLAPVRYEVEPERVVGVGVRIYETPQQAVAALIERGLRASLESTSLITGAQQVALDFVPKAAPAKLEIDGGDFVLPTTSGGGFAGLQQAANALLDKVGTIPFDAIGKNLESILKSVNDLAGSAQAKEALTNLAATLAAADSFTRNLDRGTASTFKQLPELSNRLQKTVNNADKLLVSLDAGYGDNTRFNRDLNRLLVQLNDAVTAIRSLADLLQRHPEALIKGRGAGKTE
jgi:paraquat-inducible protein B